MVERMVEYVGWKDPIGDGYYRIGVTKKRIVRCRDCKHFDEIIHACDHPNISALRGDVPENWILSVSDMDFCSYGKPRCERSSHPRLQPWGASKDAETDEARKQEEFMNTLHPTVKVKRVNPDATLPAKAHQTDAAYDLCAMEDVTLGPGEWEMVGCGLAFAIPAGWCGMVYPRSGLGCKGLVLKNTVGVIDSHYRGEVMLPLFNNNEMHREGGYIAYAENHNGTIHVHKGDRVAQMRIEMVPDSTLVEAEELDDTERGQGGFGSTGISGGARL